MRFWVALMRWAASLKLSTASSRTESSLVTREVYWQLVDIPLQERSGSFKRLRLVSLSFLNRLANRLLLVSLSSRRMAVLSFGPSLLLPSPTGRKLLHISRVAESRLF